MNKIPHLTKTFAQNYILDLFIVSLFIILANERDTKIYKFERNKETRGIYNEGNKTEGGQEFDKLLFWKL